MMARWAIRVLLVVWALISGLQWPLRLTSPLGRDETSSPELDVLVDQYLIAVRIDENGGMGIAVCVERQRTTLVPQAAQAQHQMNEDRKCNSERDADADDAHHG